MSNNDYFSLAPDLDFYLSWSSRMSDALHNRYKLVIYRRSEASQQGQREYDIWCHTQAMAYKQIQRLYTLTDSLPVVGDRLLHELDSNGGEILRIDKRTLFTTPDSNSLLLVYELSGEEDEIAEWAAYPDDATVQEQD